MTSEVELSRRGVFTSTSPTWGTLCAAGPTSLDVRTNDAWVAKLLATAYAPLHVNDKTALAHHRATFIHTDRAGRLLFDDCEVTYRNAEAVDPFTRAFYAMHALFAHCSALVPEQISLYGAAVLIDGFAVLLLGPSVVGKTTLALHMAHQGARFLGDETVLFDPQRGLLSALPRRPALREPALSLLPTDALRVAVNDSPHFVRSDKGKFWYGLCASDLGGIGPDPSAYRLGAIVELVRGSEPAIEPGSSSATLANVLARAYARPTTFAHIGAIHRALQNVSSFTLTLGAPHESAALLIERIRACV